MKTNFSELLAALPKEDEMNDANGVEITQEQLQAIFADLSLRPVPTGSLHRMWTLGELSTQVALAYTALWIRGWFANAEKKKQQKMETNLRVALKMIHGLGYLRGAATKLGQAFGNLHLMLPEQVISTFDMLRAQAPPMHYSLLREMVRNELGKDPSEIFATFDKEPFAAASIGQVHRATLKSGETVAVKIQYPGIARAMEADVRNLMALIFPMRLTKNWEQVKGQCQAIHDMLREEVDYVHEAQNMRAAAALFEPEDGIVVPRVFEKYSTRKILTTEFLSGMNCEEFLATNPPLSLRNNFGMKMGTAWYRLYYAYMNNGDPHSGNFVLMNDGRLGLLDFGCVQFFTPEERIIIDEGEQFLDGKMTLMDLLGKNGTATSADLANPDYIATFQHHYDFLLKPLQTDGAFDYADPAEFREGIDSIQQIVQKRYIAAAPMYVYMVRSLFGMRALAYRMGCRYDQKPLRQNEIERRRKRGAHEKQGDGHRIPQS